jgi:hypothetical protein
VLLVGGVCGATALGQEQVKGLVHQFLARVAKDSPGLPWIRRYTPLN